MKKVIKIIIILLLIVALIIGGIFIFKKFMNKPDDSKEPMVVEIKKLDEIKGFSYFLYDNSTDLYKRGCVRNIPLVSVIYLFVMC